MRAAIAASISFALLSTLGGCGKPPPLGTFRGARHLAVNPGTDPVIANQLNRVDLRLMEDRRATLEDGGVPYEGLISRHDDDLEFEILAIGGINIERQPADQPRTLKFKISGPDAIQFGDVKLEKVNSGG